MRLSRQRRMVLDLLWSERSHLSAGTFRTVERPRTQHRAYLGVSEPGGAAVRRVIECLDRASGRLYGYR